MRRLRRFSSAAAYIYEHDQNDPAFMLQKYFPSLSSIRHHYTIVFLALAVCLFLYVDAYWVPQHYTIEEVTSVDLYYGRKGSKSYALTTSRKQYDVTEGLYNNASIGDTVLLEKSRLTGAVQFITLVKGSQGWQYETGFVRARGGWLFVPVLIVGIVVLLLTMRIIDSVQGRANLCYAVFICALLLLFSHIDLNLF